MKIGLRHIYEKKAEGAIFRSKVRWIQESKKLTKYFFNLEKKNFNEKVISELRMADSHVSVNESQIMKETGFSTVNVFSRASKAQAPRGFWGHALPENF